MHAGVLLADDDSLRAQDDLGYGDISVYPNPSERRLHTPHVAELATKGIRFTDACTSAQS